MTFLQGGGEGGIIKIITRILLRRSLQCSKWWLSFSNYCLQSVLCPLLASRCLSRSVTEPDSKHWSTSSFLQHLQPLVYVILPPTPPSTGLHRPSSNTSRHWSTSSFFQHLLAPTPPSTGLRHPFFNTSCDWSTSSFLQHLQVLVYVILPPTPPSTGLRHPFFNTPWHWSTSSFLQHLQVLVYIILPPTPSSTGLSHPFHNTAIISDIIGLGKLWANCFSLVLKWQ